MADKKNWWEEPTKAPTIKDAPTVFKADTTTYLDTSDGRHSQKERDYAEKALENHGDFNFLQQDWMNEILNGIKNREKFSYNFNEDALYQQYKDKYIKQGKMAMADTIGQASAMTGGYGNSYAQSVGQQAYNAHLENLNDIVPELYQMAYDRYNNETQDLYNQYGLLMEEYKRQYGEHSDEYQKLLDTLNRADSNFYNDASLYNTELGIKNDAGQKAFENEFNMWDANNQNAWKQAEWDEGLRQYAEKMAFEKQQYEDSNKVKDNNPYTPPKKEDDKPVVEPKSYSGTNYSDAVDFAKANGVPASHAAGIMTNTEWARRRKSYESTGQGGTEVTQYTSYKEYLAGITEYLIELYNK